METKSLAIFAPGLFQRLPQETNDVSRLVAGILFSALASLSFAPAAKAQLIPDNTLPINSVVAPGCVFCTITGGTLSNNGQTLFHSFQQFSIPTGGTAAFQNNLSLVNIVTRVTGPLPSNIDGLISAQGNVDVFLINPNGIVFGANARLQVPRSFIASTADSFVFADGTTFSATGANAAPLLTVSAPTGLQFGRQNQTVSNIRVEGPGNFPPTLPGLSVPAGNTLALVGNNLEVAGGTLSAPVGRLALGSVTQGTVRFSPLPGSNRVSGFELKYDEAQAFGQIHLSQGALVNASGPGGGDITLQGQTVLVEGGSQVLSVTTGALPGGNLRITATDAVTAQGASANGQQITRLSTDTLAAGVGGSLIVNTPQLRISDRALLSASTAGSGQGGNLVLNVPDFIDITGTGYANLQRLFVAAIQGTLDITAAESGLLAGSGSSGNAGQLLIETGRLLLQDGAIISTTASGGGAGGDAEITATESVDIVASVLLTGALQGTTQKAGNLRLNTQRLSLRDGGLLQTFTLGSGEGGDLIVTATELVELLNTPIGAVVPTGIFANSIFGTGPGGDIKVNTQQLAMAGGAQIGNQTGALLGTGLVPLGGSAGDVILKVGGTTTIDGLSPDGRFGSGPGTSSFSGSPAGNVMLTTGNLFIRGGANISTTTFSNGDGGTLTVNVADVLELSGTGTRNSFGVPVTLPSSLVSSSGRADFPGLVGNGAAGTLEVNAGQLIIQEGGAIAIDSLGPGDAGTLTATADLIRLDTGGAITAATAAGAGGNVMLRTPVLLLRRGSNINTDAGNADGGNISLDTDVLIALENSDITANALQGRGGRVSITAQSIFGTAFSENLTPDSDITATSALGPDFNGEVDLNTPAIDPKDGLVQLPTIDNNPGDRIEAGCSGDRGNRFVMAGQGGLPPTPNQPLAPSGGWQDLRFLNEIPPVINSPSPRFSPLTQEQAVFEQSAQEQSVPAPTTQEQSMIGQVSPIREASFVGRNEKGEIMLLAEPSNVPSLQASSELSGECMARYSPS